LNNVDTPNNPNDEDFDPECVSKDKKSVMYAKDFSFSEKVPEWLEDLKKILPPFITPYDNYDLMGYLDEATRPIVWMGYMGNGGTRTPLHLDKIASIAINLHAIGEGIKMWWLMDHKQSDQLEAEIKNCGGSLWKDSYWMAPHELEATGIPMWYHEQKKGDLIIVPPMVPHTVINSGPLSCAVAANMLQDQVVNESWQREKINRTIHRSSIYRLKPTVFNAIKTLTSNPIGDFEMQRLKKLLPVWREIVKEEETKDEAKLTEDGWYLCDGCGADIFNKRYHCGSCRSGDYDLCVLCYSKFGKDHSHTMKLLEKHTNIILKELLIKAAHIVGDPAIGELN